MAVLQKTQIQNTGLDFPGGAADKKALIGHRFDPPSWKVSRAVEQLSPCSRSHHNEKPVHCNEDPAQAKINK